MKNFTAVVKEKRTGNIRIITSNDFNNKGYFAQELRANGFTVRGIYNDSQVAHIKSIGEYEATVENINEDAYDRLNADCY